MNDSKGLRFVLADDHPMFRCGLKTVIERATGYLVVGEADDGKAACSLIRELEPDIAILDIEMPGMTGLEVAERIYQENLRVSVIILSMYEEYALFNKAIDAGVKGYIVKESAVTDIRAGIDAVASGGYYFSPTLTAHFLKRSTQSCNPPGRAGNSEALTVTEQQILKLLAASLSSREIAERLHVSVRTIETHRYNIAQKLHLNGSYALLRYALSHGGQV